MEEIKQKLNDVLSELDEEYRQWYKRASKQSFWLWFSLQFIAIIPGFAVSIIVAVFEDSEFSTVRPWIVTLTALGSLVGFIIVQFKIYDIWKIRADGEVAFDNLYRYAVGKISMIQTKDEAYLVYEELRKLINEIEADAVKRFFSLSTSEFVATWKNK